MRRSWAGRWRELRADPVLWILLSTSAARSLGRGLLISLSTLYFTRILGIPITDVGAILFVASFIGLVGSYLGGLAADRLPVRRLIGSAFFGEVVALLGYASVPTLGLPPVAALSVFAGLAMVSSRFGGTANQAVVARAFVGPQRVRAQALMRTVTNVGVAIGGGLAAIPLALDSTLAYQATLLVAAGAYTLAGLSALRLPSSVDARQPGNEPSSVAPADGSRSPWRNPRFLLLGLASTLVVFNFMVTDVAHPQWVSAHTAAPPVLVSAILIINTGLVVALQLPVSRFTHDIAGSGRIILLAGTAFWIGALLAWSAGQFGTAAAVALMLAAAVLHALGEVASASAMWALGYALTPRSRAGRYQGLLSLANGVGLMLAPLVIAYTAMSLGLAGWLILGGVMALGCLLAYLATRNAEPADADAA